MAYAVVGLPELSLRLFAVPETPKNMGRTVLDETFGLSGQLPGSLKVGGGYYDLTHTSSGAGIIRAQPLSDHVC